MPDYFQTQSDRAQQAYQRGWEKESAVHRVDRQLRSVQRIDAMGSASAQASKAQAIAALNRAKQQYKRAEDVEPSAAAVSAAKARRVARGQLVAARADLSIAVIELLRATAKPIADAMESLTVPIAERAIDGWPVQSGRSRDAIMCNVQMSGTVVSFTMSNDAPYIYYIKQGKRTTSDKRRLKRGQAAWVTLIRTPMYRAADKVAAEIERRFKVK
jgi:multidrug efflux pump subunit AcrA (membrane-fusion protein)